MVLRLDDKAKKIAAKRIAGFRGGYWINPHDDELEQMLATHDRSQHRIAGTPERPRHDHRREVA